MWWDVEQEGTIADVHVSRVNPKCALRLIVKPHLKPLEVGNAKLTSFQHLHIDLPLTHTFIHQRVAAAV